MSDHRSGFVRITTNPSCLSGSDALKNRPAPFWRNSPIVPATAIGRSQGAGLLLTAPFASRIFGHQQVTDAYLLGMAIKEDGVLVTFDRGLRYFAGPEFSRNLLVLE